MHTGRTDGDRRNLLTKCGAADIFQRFRQLQNVAIRGDSAAWIVSASYINILKRIMLISSHEIEFTIAENQYRLFSVAFFLHTVSILINIEALARAGKTPINKRQCRLPSFQKPCSRFAYSMVGISDGIFLVRKALETTNQPTTKWLQLLFPCDMPAYSYLGRFLSLWLLRFTPLVISLDLRKLDTSSKFCSY